MGCHRYITKNIYIFKQISVTHLAHIYTLANLMGTQADVNIASTKYLRALLNVFFSKLLNVK